MTIEAEHARGDASTAATRAPAWIPEIAGWAAALAVSLIAIGQVATVSDVLLFTDGDSLVVPMIVRSIAAGQPQDWAMSPVLFLPETAVFGALSLLGLDVRATLVLNALVNLLAFYGALRVVAGRRAPGRLPIVAAVGGLVLFVVVAVLEGSASRNGFALATLLTTTTYYSATVIATALTVGLVRRSLSGGRTGATAAGIAAIGLVSVLSNPLFVVWAVLPVVGVLLVFTIARRIPVTSAVVLGGALSAGAIVGFASRTAVAGSIVATSENYVRASERIASFEHFRGVLTHAATQPHGLLWLALLSALALATCAITVRAWRRDDVTIAFVGGVAILSAVGSVVGTILVGSDAQRYLQPCVFLLVMAVVAGATRPVALSWSWRPLATVAVAAVFVVGALGSLPRVAAAATEADDDLACVVDWVTRSDRTGAGQFWTVRAAKANLDTPTQLVQVDHQLRPYDWLVNRGEPRPAAVSFLLQDASSPAFELPAGLSTDDATRTDCGGYTLFDFGEPVLPLGVPRN